MHIVLPVSEGSPGCVCSCAQSCVAKLWTHEWHPHKKQRDVERQLNICCSEAYLPTCKLPFNLNRHWGRFNICWAKPCTPVFLFLLSSGPEPPMFSFPPWLFPPRSYTSLFNLLLASQRGSEGIPAAHAFGAMVPFATNHTVGYLQWGKSKFLFWGWPWRMWVLPLAGDCGCLVWASMSRC